MHEGLQAVDERAGVHAGSGRGAVGADDYGMPEDLLQDGDRVPRDEDSQGEHGTFNKRKRKMKNIMMIDIETSGTKPGCRVLTLGAFGFDRDGNQVDFYRRFDATKLREEGFTDDLSTVEWWCSKCSACQTDLFDEDQKAICLDPDCWKKMVKAEASRRVEEYRANGTEATTDAEEYRDNAIPAWKRERIENAKKEGVAEHVYIDEDDCEETRYIDMRDLPGYHEESEEEREEREEQEAASRNFENVKDRIFNDKIKNRLEKAIERGDDEDLLAFIVAAGIDNCDLVTEKDRKEILEIEEDSYGITAEDLPASKGIEDIAKAVRSSLPSYVNHIYNIDLLKALYRIFCGGDADTLIPTDEEVQAEIDRQETEKAKQESEEE